MNNNNNEGEIVGPSNAASQDFLGSAPSASHDPFGANNHQSDPAVVYAPTNIGLIGAATTTPATGGNNFQSFITPGHASPVQDYQGPHLYQDPLQGHHHQDPSNHQDPYQGYHPHYYQGPYQGYQYSQDYYRAQGPPHGYIAQSYPFAYTTAVAESPFFHDLVRAEVNVIAADYTNKLDKCFKLGKEQQETIVGLRSEIVGLRSDVDRLMRKCEEQSITIDKQSITIDKQSITIDKQSNAINELKGTIVKQSITIDKQSNAINELKEKVSYLHEENRDLGKQIKDLFDITYDSVGGNIAIVICEFLQYLLHFQPQEAHPTKKCFYTLKDYVRDPKKNQEEGKFFFEWLSDFEKDEKKRLNVCVELDKIINIRNEFCHFLDINNEVEAVLCTKLQHCLLMMNKHFLGSGFKRRVVVSALKFLEGPVGAN